MNVHKGKALVVGTIFGSIMCVVMLMLFAFSFVKMKKLPHEIVSFIAVFCASVSSFFSGYVVVRILREKGLMYGAVAGFIFFLTLLISGIAVSGEILTWFTIVKGSILVFMGSLGGIVSVNKRVRAR